MLAWISSIGFIFEYAVPFVNVFAQSAWWIKERKKKEEKCYKQSNQIQQNYTCCELLVDFLHIAQLLYVDTQTMHFPILSILDDCRNYGIYCVLRGNFSCFIWIPKFITNFEFDISDARDVSWLFLNLG